MTLFHNAVDAVVLAYNNMGKEEVLRENMEFYNKPMVTQYNIILSLTLIFNTAAILFLGHLISFHIYL